VPPTEGAPPKPVLLGWDFSRNESRHYRRPSVPSREATSQESPARKVRGNVHDQPMSPSGTELPKPAQVHGCAGAPPKPLFLGCDSIADPAVHAQAFHPSFLFLGLAFVNLGRPPKRRARLESYREAWHLLKE
jgi:hypothetical protein